MTPELGMRMRLPMKCGVCVLCSEISPHNTINVRFNRRIKLPIDVTRGMSLPGQYYAKKGELRQNGIYLPPGLLRLNFFTNYCWYIELKIISLSKTQNYRNPFPTVRKLFTILSAVFAAALFLPEAYASSVNENERADSTAVVREDSVFIFRFKNRTNMFFMHFGGNEDVIRRAAEMIDRNREALKRGDMYLAIHGYCSSFVSEYSNMAMASNRSNQVKSYYITNHGLREDNYCTYNHAVPYNGDKDVVTTMQLIAMLPTPPAMEN